MNKQNHPYLSAIIILVVCVLLLSVGTKSLSSPKSEPVLQSKTDAPPTEAHQPQVEPQAVKPPVEPIPAQIVVQFAPNTTQQQRAAYIESIGGTVVQNIDSLDTVVLTVPEEVAQEPLPESPVVEQSEPDYFVAALDDIAPINDPRYAEQWALPAIGAPEAWAQIPADAPKVTVAVIDSGICASHPDLAGRILDGWDFLESDAVPQDDFGHGCSVSGVIAANMNDGIGIAGVAPNAQVMPLRVLNASGIGSYSDVAAAIVYAADNGAQVINLSLGGSNPSSTLENAVNYAVSKGMIVVAAAGNSGMEGALYPAAYPDVIAVGSVDPNLQHSNFSNYGAQIDIWAPGRDILTTRRDGVYGLVSGTSFAAPYVAGAEAINIDVPLLHDSESLWIGTQPLPTATSIATAEVETPISTSETPINTSNNLLVDPELENLIKEKIQLHGFLNDPNAALMVLDTNIEYPYAVIGYYVADPENLPDSFSPNVALAYNDGENWSVRVREIDQESFNDLLDAIPQTVLSYDSKVIYAYYPPHAVDAQATYSGHYLPWPNGIAYPVTQRPGGCGSHCTGSKGEFAWDFGMPNGAEVWASKAGTVAHVQDDYAVGTFSWNTSWNLWCTPSSTPPNYVVINHDQGASLYLHLKQNSVPGEIFVGARPEKGAHVGGAGNVGYVCSSTNSSTSGTHLHYQVEQTSSSYWSQSGSVDFADWDEQGSNPTSGNVRGGGSSGGGGTGKGCDQVSYNGVELYEHANCNRDTGGKTKSFSSTTGWTDIVSDFNDITSSIYVKSGWSVKVFEKSVGEGGGSWRCITGSMWDLSTDKYTNGDTNRIINNDISSVQVYNNTNCSGGGGGGGTNNPPSGFTWCANEGNRCNFSGTADVVYGAVNSFTSPRSFTNGVDCNNNVFGDPLNGQPKACYFKLTSPPPPPNWAYQIFDLGDFNGGMYQGNQTINDLSSVGKNDWAESMKINSGYEIIACEHANFGGVCGRASGPVQFSDLNVLAQGLRGQLSSIKVCAGSCPSAPGAPSLSSPGNGSSNPYNYDLTLQWNSVSNATSYLVEWWGGPYSAMQPCGWSSSTSCHIGTVAQGNTYYWHVKARNSNGESGWSSTWSFNIQTQPTAPSAPTLSSPGNGSSNPHNYDLTFQWNSAPGATEYQIEWWGGPYSTMQPCGWSGATSCHIGTVTPGNTYSWHVRARNSYGTSSWSPTWTFTIQPTPLPDLIPFPRSGASDPIVVSRSANWPYTEEIISGQTAYFYWGYKNNGQSNAGAHHVKVYIDNNQFIDYPFGSRNAGDAGGFDNWSESFYIAPGAHTVKIVVDANNEINESNESNNTWTGTVYWRDPAISLYGVYTTDDLGPAAEGNKVSADGVQSKAYKDTFNFGDPIRFYLWFGSEFTDSRTVTAEWQVINPAGRVVDEFSFTDIDEFTGGGWNWWITRMIPAYGLRGQYTFIGKITYNGVTSTKTHTFTVTGPPTVEVYDVFVTDENGSAASLEVIPQRSVPLDVKSESVPTFNAGDGIRLYINTYNDVADGETATFEWEVIDPWGRWVEELSWYGDLNSSVGHAWWSLPGVIPSHAITGDYTFTGYITHGDRTTYQSQTFHVTGPAGPANDSFSAPVVIGSVPYNGTKNTWGATTAVSDPTPTCGSGKNSNSVWYRYTASSTGLLEIDTWGSDYDTVLAVWTGTSGNLNQIACNDDAYGYIESWLEDVPVTAGITYYIEVMDYGGPGGGNLELYVDFAPSTSNNDFNSPVTITTNPASLTLNTGGATKASDDPELNACNRLPGEASVWYRYVATWDGELQVDTKGSDYDTMLAVWTGTRGNLTSLGCNDDVGDVNGEWDQDSILNVQVTTGTTYYIEVSTFAGKIDVNGASAAEVENKPDVFNSASARSLQERKAEIDKNGGLLTGLQENRNDLQAQFWGGQLKLNVVYEPTPAPQGKYDNEHGGWTYTDFVQSSPVTGPYEGTFHYSSVVGGTAEFVIDGSQITLTYTKYYKYGNLEVYVDDVLKGTINQYDPARVWLAEWTSGDLGAGPHTVRLVHGGPSGKIVNVDAIEVKTYVAPPSYGTGTYDNAHAGWTYTDFVQSSPVTGPYEGTFHYSSVVGGTAEFVIEGSQITLTYSKYYKYGNLEVYVDDILKGTINQYDAARVWLAEWTSGDLGAGPHTVRLVHAGPSGKIVNVDAIEVKTYVPPPSQGIGTYDNAHAGWTYTDFVQSSPVTGPYLGTFHYSSVVGGTAEFPIDGSQITLTYSKYYKYGNLEVYVDDILRGTINQYDPARVWLAEWTSGNLGAGTHTVRLVHGGPSGKIVNIDAIEVKTYVAPPSYGTGTYDNAHAGWAYTGFVQSSPVTGPYLETFHYSTVVGGTAEFPIDGSQITLTYTKYYKYGNLEVYVDDILKGTIDQYDPARVWLAEWTSGDLGAGPHIVRLVHAGPSDKIVNIDAIEVP